MIPFDIDFLQPDTIAEATTAWREATEAGRRPRWFSGGTELVTGARERSDFDVLIDLKRIPELTDLDLASGTIGAATRLSALSEQADSPLVARAAGGIADRTVRNSITIGGNVCGMLPYREAVLPLLLFEADATIAGPRGTHREPVTARFEKRLRLEPGEFLVSVHLPDAARTDGFYARRTRDARVDYPLVTLCMARVDGALRLAVSGVHGYPVRSAEAEAALAAAGSRDRRRRAEAAADSVPDRVWDDFRAGADYRRELFVQAIENGLTALEDA